MDDQSRGDVASFELYQRPVKLDEELERELGKSIGDPDSAVRTAFIIPEDRIRNAAGLGHERFGVDLVNAAFHPDKGILRDLSRVGAERQGLYDLFHGAFLLYRNPAAHRRAIYTTPAAESAITVANHLLKLVQETLESQAQISRYIGAHEGALGNLRRYFRLDIDNDGDAEQVILVNTGPLRVRDSDRIDGRLLTLVLDRVGDNYVRIPCDYVEGTSIYGPHRVEMIPITTSDRPDLVVGWTFGEAQLGYFILRWQHGHYDLVTRDYEGLQEPYAGIWPHGFMTHPTWQDVQFVDCDGDGLVEIVHVLGVPSWNMEEYQESTSCENNRFKASRVCRVYKWDSDSQKLAMVDETVQLIFDAT